MPRPLPHHPRIANHVQARRQIVDGKEIVVVTDGQGNKARVITPEQWDMLACADGTRTVDGIFLAAAGNRIYSRASAFRDLIEDMNEEGLVDEGLESLSLKKPSPPPDTPSDRPLLALPGYSLTCDLSGRCCGVYPSISFSELETARARSLRPDVLDGGSKPWQVFTPYSGSRALKTFAVTLVDGNCAYLEPSGLCSLHASAGPEAKPYGCRHFPLTHHDDGVHVRVSIRTECPCTFSSIGSEGGAPLVPPGARTAGDLPTDFDVVPERVEVTPSASCPRAEVVEWSNAALLAHKRRADALSTLWTLAAALEQEGPTPTGVTRWLLDREPVLPTPAEVRPWLGAVAAQIQEALEGQHAWRGPRDRCRTGLRLISGAARRLMELEALSAALAPRDDPQDERVYVNAALFGPHLLSETVVTALRDRAVRVLVSRALVPLLARENAAADAAHPLAIVDQVFRAAGTSAYPDRLPSPSRTT